MPLKKRRKGIRSGCGIALCLACLVLAALLCFPISQLVGYYRVRTADKTAILIACRQMIANYDSYTNDWKNTVTLDEGEKAIELFDSETGNVYSPSDRLPAPIRELKPIYIVIGKDHLYIALRSPLGSRIEAFADGANQNRRKHEGKRVVITNGLWYSQIN